MMKRLSGLAVLALLVGSAPLSAQQVRFGVGIVPVISLESGGGSDFGIGALVDYIPNGTLGARFDGAYIFDDYVLFNADAAYHFITANSQIHPFILGGAAFAASTASGGGSQFGLGAGAGANIHMRNSPIGFYVDARFQRFFDPGISQLQLGGGIRFGRGE